MSEKELLQAILDVLTPMKADIESLKSDSNQSKMDISGIKILLEADIQRQINLISEDVQLIRDRMPDSGDIADLQDQISTLITVVKLHSEDIKSLKKAQ